MSPKFVDQVQEKTRRWLWFLSLVWLGLSILVVAYDWLSESDWPRLLTSIYFHATIVCSLIAFAMYGWDKKQAEKGGRRIPERRLHRMAMFGGWPGAILGQQYFRHKTQKVPFRLKSGLILAVHLLIILWGLQNFLFSWL